MKEEQTDAAVRVMKELAKDKKLREKVIKELAKNYAKEFLAPVKINAADVSRLAGKHVLVSDKEWQE